MSVQNPTPRSPLPQSPTVPRARERGDHDLVLPLSGAERRLGGEVFSGLRSDLTLYWLLLRAQASAQLQYRASFFLQSLGQFLATFTDFILLVLLFQRFPSVAGWTFGEVAFLYGLGGAAFGLSDLICGGFDNLSKMIRLGTFDRVLTRPVGTFAQVLASDLQIRRAGRITQSLLVLAVAVVWLDVAWTAPKLLVAISAVISGTVIFTAIWVIGAAITFWTIETSEITNVFTYGGDLLTSYPMPIYAEGLRRFFTYVVPLAFVSYLPALYILEREDPLGLPPVLQLCSPIVAVAFLIVARGCWALGVRHYQSTGN
jgi:ABC-2 type transport system permease protein